MTDVCCRTCSRPMPDSATLCRPCTAELSAALAEVPSLAEELDVTLTRQSRLGDGGKGGETPVPFDPRASAAAHELRTTLVGWVRDLYIQGHRPDDTVPAMARWLTRRLDSIRTHSAGDEIHHGITTVVKHARHAIDRPPERWYAGRCDCDADLYAKAGASIVRCHLCGASYDVKQRRAWLLDACEDVLGHAELIARAVTSLGQQVTSASIRGYAHRGRLVAHGEDWRGRPQFRVGDVLDLVAEQAQKQAS